MNSSSTRTGESGFERGFKTWAENVSLSTRERLGVAKVAPLDPDALAAYLEVRVWNPNDVPGLPKETKRYLCSPEGDEWSALAVRVGDVDVVVLNPSHSKARRASDLVHELAHLLRKHKPAQVYISPDTGISIRNFDTTQEDEADWLAGCLLLPRLALTHCLAQKWPDEVICDQYGVSKELLRFRMNVSGAKKQFSPSRTAHRA